MSPIKQPHSLQKLCLECGCHAILRFAIESQQYYFQLKWHDLCCYIEKFVPPKFHCDLFHGALKKLSVYPLDYIRPETVAFLLQLLLHPMTKKLNFSDLANAGETSYDMLDRFESMFSAFFPYMPSLTHLNLSTHRNDSSLPSCSYDVLYTIGKHCPNLRILDLSYNNRVTSDGLHCLAPSKYNKGCPYLEEIYVQDCSVTPSDIVWLIRNFKNLQNIGYRDMGTILKELMHISHRGKRFRLKLTEFDNSESTCSASDGNVMSLISKMCPNVENLKVRVCDEDSIKLCYLKRVMKLTLRFYTGVYHSIGPVTITYFASHGHFLTSLTIYCALLNSYHVSAVASSCVNLKKLFLCSNSFEELDDSFLEVPNKLRKLNVLSIKIGLHEMDESPSADFLATYLISSCPTLQEIFLLLLCSHVNYEFLINCLRKNSLMHLKVFICDASQSQGLPIVNLGYRSVLLMIETCPQLITIGNLRSWCMSQAEVDDLKRLIRIHNLDISLIH